MNDLISLLKCPKRVKHLFFRAGVLFVFGNIVAIIVKLLQTDGKIVQVWFEKTDVTSIVLSPWWIPPIFGLFATFSGLLYPWIDHSGGSTCSPHRDWTNVVRCITSFIGLNHASAKFQLFDSSNAHLFTILCCIGIMMWWVFDGSKSGLFFGIAAAILGTCLTYIGAQLTCRHSSIFSKYWLPCLYFAAACTFGNVGRMLAKMDDSLKSDLAVKDHGE